jgi:hypothetical protein
MADCRRLSHLNMFSMAISVKSLNDARASWDKSGGENCGQMLDNRPNYGQPIRPMRIKIPISKTMTMGANLIRKDDTKRNAAFWDKAAKAAKPN